MRSETARSFYFAKSRSSPCRRRVMSFLGAQSTHRRGFLGHLTAGTLAVMGVASVDPQTVEAEALFGAGADDWLAGITGTHRQFFAGVTVNDGFPFGFALTFLNTIGETYKV